MRLHLLKQQPWRFKPSDRVYVRGWHPERTVEILDVAPGVFPTYLCLDELGATWRIAQIELSSRPIFLYS
jgi:hypothetical protein